MRIEQFAIDYFRTNETIGVKEGHIYNISKSTLDEIEPKDFIDLCIKDIEEKLGTITESDKKLIAAFVIHSVASYTIFKGLIYESIVEMSDADVLFSWDCMKPMFLSIQFQNAMKDFI